MRRIRLLVPAALVLGLGTAAAAATAPDTTAPQASPAASALDPTAFLRERDQHALSLLGQAGGDSLSPQLRARIKEHINRVFDFATLSRLALGEHWQGRTAAERQHFTEVFTSIIQEQNLDTFVRYYREGKINYQSQQVHGDTARVTALVPLKREQIEVGYRLRRHDGSWRVYDLVIDGVSTAEGNRRRYAGYIQKHSYAELVARLEEQLARLRSTARGVGRQASRGACRHRGPGESPRPRSSTAGRRGSLPPPTASSETEAVLPADGGACLHRRPAARLKQHCRPTGELAS
ncbi:MAG: ABC transporter substrate-binding protein, partial [Candidatus Latescibacterota bacterium]